MSGGIKSPFEKAAELGRRVVLPADDELFIDIDDAESLAWYRKAQRVMFEHGLLEEREFGGPVERVSPSPSGRPDRYHVVLKFKHALTTVARIAFQAAMGSDPMRELLSLIQVHKGEPHPVVFFELAEPEPVTPPHACECCTEAPPIPMADHMPHCEVSL